MPCAEAAMRTELKAIPLYKAGSALCAAYYHAVCRLLPCRVPLTTMPCAAYYHAVCRSGHADGIEGDSSV